MELPFSDSYIELSFRTFQKILLRIDFTRVTIQLERASELIEQSCLELKFMYSKMEFSLMPFQKVYLHRNFQKLHSVRTVFSDIF